MSRPDRASGLMIRSKKDINTEGLTKVIGMIRGVVRVVGLDYKRLMVVFETQQRTSEDEYGWAIKAAVDAMLDSDTKAEWLEEDFSAGYTVVSDVRREVFEELRAIAKRVYGHSSALTGTGVEAVEIRSRCLLTRMIEDLAGEILSPKKPAAT